MLKCALLAAFVAGSLPLSPALARDTRSSQSIPPPEKARGSDASGERLAQVVSLSTETCDAPGNGKKNGHHSSNGLGHLFAPGKGHACDRKSPG